MTTKHTLGLFDQTRLQTNHITMKITLILLTALLLAPLAGIL